ncbi:MAG: type VII secretion-associated serine protease mycosin [Pseudonocardia sp.]
MTALGRCALALLGVLLTVAAPAPGLMAHTVPHGTAALPSPPDPPPLRTAPPAGRAPGPAPGLRAPQHCTPPAGEGPLADPSTHTEGPLAGPSRDTEGPLADPSRDTDVAQRLQLAAVHQLAVGDGQLIAVIDTGIYPHERLGIRLRAGGDYLTGGDGRSDCDGHGTKVAGLLAAAPSPHDELVGIAPAAELLAIRHSSQVFETPGPDGELRHAGDVRTLAEAIVFAVRRQSGVINISEAACLPPTRAAVEGASLQAALRFAAQHDVVVVAAAGNAGVGGCTVDGGPDQVSVPGWYGDDVLAVAAVDPDDAPAPFTVPGPWVDVAAPGTALRSLAVGGQLTSDGVEGTSFAAPWVAGLAALVRQRFPDLTAIQVTDRIRATARRPAGGRDDAIGYGVVDPVAALTAEPAVLEPASEDRDPPTADLRGTAPVPPPRTPGAPFDVLAVVAMLGVAGVATALLRRRPGRG